MHLPKVYLIILTLISSLAKGQYSIDTALWKAIVVEDFNSNTLDTQRWDTHFAYDGGDSIGCADWFCARYNPKNLTIEKGNLYLRTSWDTSLNHAQKGVASLIRSKLDEFPDIDNNDKYPGGFLFGRIEIRCKLPKLAGQFPALWLSGNNSWPPEIDIIEAYTGNGFFEISNNIFWENKQNEQHFYKLRKRELKQFHTFQLVWTPQRVSFFMDGKELRTIENKVQFTWSHFEHVVEMVKWSKMDLIVNSNFLYPRNNLYEQYPQDPFVIDYIKIYKPLILKPYKPNTDVLTYYVNQLLPVYQAIDDKERDRNKTKRLYKKPYKVILKKENK